LHGTLTALQTELAALQGQQSYLTGMGNNFVTQINAAQAVNQQNLVLQQSAAFQVGMEGGTNTNASIFGSVDNPATGGSGDPGTTGNWYTGAWGANIGNPSTVGVALPSSVLVNAFGSTAAANGAQVQVTNTATGQTAIEPLVDIGPGQNSQANGYGIDLTSAGAAQIGATSGSQVTYRIVGGLPGGNNVTTIGR
jgi:hypothetical protein